MTKNYHLIANHKIIVQNPNEMDRDKQSGKHICPECDLPFDTCLCPKPWSSLKIDGYYTSKEGEQMVAYPSLEVYEELMLWIFRNREHVVCGHCLKSVRAEWGMPEELYEIMVEQFFAIHQECYDGKNIEYFLIEDDGFSNPHE